MIYSGVIINLLSNIHLKHKPYCKTARCTLVAEVTQQSKGVQQSVKCQFRKEDFLKRVRQSEGNLDVSNERFVEGINGKDDELQQKGHLFTAFTKFFFYNFYYITVHSDRFISI